MPQHPTPGLVEELVYFDGLQAKHVVDYRERRRRDRISADTSHALGAGSGYSFTYLGQAPAEFDTPPRWDRFRAVFAAAFLIWCLILAAAILG